MELEAVTVGVWLAVPVLVPVIEVVTVGLAVHDGVFVLEAVTVGVAVCVTVRVQEGVFDAVVDMVVEGVPVRLMVPETVVVAV
jgi:hypothetical protein